MAKTEQEYEEIGKRLRSWALGKYKSLTAFGRALGVSPQVVNDYVGGRKRPGIDMQRKIEALGADMAFIMTGREVLDPDVLIQSEYPVVSRIRAGSGENGTAYVMESRESMPGPALRGLAGAMYFEVDGDSMQPMYWSGDLVLAHPNHHPTNGEFGIIGYDNDQSCLKQFFFNGHILTLRSLNPRHEDIVLDLRHTDVWFRGKIIFVIPGQNKQLIRQIKSGG